MCGRFYVPEKELDDFARLVAEVEQHLLKKHGEIYPGDTVPIITPGEENREVHAVKWGFPKWKGSGLIINARSETAPSKPMFQAPFRKRRCIVPATGFYEWKKDMENEKSKKIKHWISINNQLFYMAGLYWFFRDRNDETVLYPAFTILTTEANHKMQPIHNRMPVIIPEESIEKWLNAKDINDILPMLVPPDDNETFISQIA
ncbi:MAG: SOS response-associated peptidase [Clostridiaceae bacterium]|jgi:putative SOS response-associated peptidase YedK|nr:SOS response-associated peptidase [Clostridiaceae bacterium]